MLFTPFAINPLRTLLISTGGVYPLPPFPYTQSPSCPEQSRGIPFLFTFLRTLLRFFALAQNSTLLFSGDSALLAKKHPGWGTGSLISMDRTTSPEETASARRAGYQRWTCPGSDCWSPQTSRESAP